MNASMDNYHNYIIYVTQAGRTAKGKASHKQDGLQKGRATHMQDGLQKGRALL
jgi:hypothetical protein